MDDVVWDGEDEMRGWMFLVTGPVRFAEWLFGPLAAIIDMVLLLFAAGWAIMEVMKPAYFDTGAFIGLSWVSDPIWFSLHVVLTVLHGLGLVRLHWRTLRAGAAFLSAWNWLFISLSLVRIEMTTGVLAYAILGGMALFGGIFLAGLPRKVA